MNDNYSRACGRRCLQDVLVSRMGERKLRCNCQATSPLYPIEPWCYHSLINFYSSSQYCLRSGLLHLSMSALIATPLSPSTAATIESWRQNVVNHLFTPTPPTASLPRYQTRLRTRNACHPPQRPPLHPVSHNPRPTQKRKAAHDPPSARPQSLKRTKMITRGKENKEKGIKEKEAPEAEYDQEEECRYDTSEEEQLRHPPGKTPRGPGRPRTSATVPPSLAGPSPLSAPLSFRASQSRQTSPSKTSGKMVNQPRSAKKVDFAMLSTCSPSLISLSVRQARKEPGLPKVVEQLLFKLGRLPAGLVPVELKVCLLTRKRSLHC